MENTSASFYTIGRLARAAGVGVETIRYYQRRQLLPVPHSDGTGGFRAYPVALVDRIRFIKRAQELGFTLDEISHLLLLEDGDDRVAIREVANERLLQVRAKLADLQKMEHMLSDLIHQCEVSAGAASCPIIQALGHSKSHC
ncbi:Hg(II)-responsive transcriptional regulator [Undibacterium sp. GrIS 1.2]|uniref:MerR family transcriptional regulator n=1 Tax=Undibacterium sp. GrIS 1.2 TaxID=3143933 RepID=UPI0033954B7C